MNSATEPPPRSSGGNAAGTPAQGKIHQLPQPHGVCRAIRIAKVVYWLAMVASVAILAAKGLPPDDRRARTAEPPVSLRSSHESLADADTAALAAEPLFERYFLDSVPEAPSVHASTLARLADGGLVAAWFGGTREGAKDVAIYTAHWNAHRGGWEPVRKLSDRTQSSRELGRYVKKLGNPVLHCDGNGRLWLYYVTVSVGGWSGGSISVKYSDDQGRSWSDARRLIAAPFLNLCNLVRSTPIALEDGGVLLPTYHEFLYQFGELLQLDRQGQVVNKFRMNAGLDSLQPTIVARSATELLAYHRRGGASQPRILFNRSEDAGQTWSPVQTLDLANPNASVAVLPTHQGELLMAFNPSESGREQLALAISSDGEEWRILSMLEDGETGQEFSYPSLIQGDSGVYHLSYTWERSRICHVTFNDAWVEAHR